MVTRVRPVRRASCAREHGPWWKRCWRTAERLCTRALLGCTGPETRRILDDTSLSQVHLQTEIKPLITVVVRGAGAPAGNQGSPG